MDSQRNEGMHCVLVMDAEGRVITNHWPVVDAELPALVTKMRAEHVGARILIDGNIASLVPTTPGMPEETLNFSITHPDDIQAALATVKVSTAMLWTTFDRAASVQAWMLQQANVFTKDLLENNSKLAEQASKLQTRFQDAMQRIDLMEIEKKLMEQDMMARRLARHTAAQNRAEEEAARPKEPKDNGWIDEILGGVSSYLTGRRPPGSGEKN